MEVRRKVTSKLTYNDSSRPPSPLKSYVTSASTTTTTTTTMTRPKAKVNSSATPTSVRKPAKSVSSVSPARPPSPSKLPKLQSTLSTQTPRVRATKSSSLRPQTAQSTPSTPVDSRPRFGSVSLRPDWSPPTADSIFPSSHSDIPDYLSDSAPRIKSRISKFAKHTSSPPGVANHRVRAPSISSSTTSSNPRSAINGTTTPRSSPPPPNHYQPLFATGDETIHANYYNYRVAKVDPASIPLPPHSPPASAVSFSSRSSVSRSSASHGEESQSANTTMSETTGKGTVTNGDLRSTLDTLVLFSGADDDLVPSEDEDHEKSKERKVMDEAKSNRKIADLEITNRSLLAINSSLEATKHRQAKEIRELRRKLRESRLILPPRAFRAVTSQESDSSTPLSPTQDDASDEDEDEDGDTYLDKQNNKVGYDDYLADDDDTYRRIRVRMNDLIETAQRALETSAKDFVGSTGGKKVLSAEEVRYWRDSTGGEGESRAQDEEEDTGAKRRRRGDDDDDSEEEDEVERMTIPRDLSKSPSPSPTPDILVTQSP